MTAGRWGPTCQRQEGAQTPRRDPNPFRMRSLPPPRTHARTARDERLLSAPGLRLYAGAHATSQSRPGTSLSAVTDPRLLTSPLLQPQPRVGKEGRKPTTRLGRPCCQTERSTASREPRLRPLSSPPHRKPQVFNQAKHLRHQLPAAPRSREALAHRPRPVRDGAHRGLPAPLVSWTPAPRSLRTTRAEQGCCCGVSFV